MAGKLIEDNLKLHSRVCMDETYTHLICLHSRDILWNLGQVPRKCKAYSVDGGMVDLVKGLLEHIGERILLSVAVHSSIASSAFFVCVYLTDSLLISLLIVILVLPTP